MVLPSVELKHGDIKCLFQAVNTSYPKAEIKFNKHYEVPLHKPLGALGRSVTRTRKHRVTASSKAGQTLIWNNLATWFIQQKMNSLSAANSITSHLERNEAHGASCHQDKQLRETKVSECLAHPDPQKERQAV